VKEEHFLRHALVAGALSLLFAGSLACAQAAQPAKSDNPTSMSSTQGAGAQSPDVAEWTSRLILMDRSMHPAKKGDIRAFAGGVLARTSKIAKELTQSALRFLGVPYVFGGTTSAGFDCSGFVQHVFAMIGIQLPRTADAQYDAGHAIRGPMRPGDLVFFQTYAPGVSHVGIYLGHGKFVSASDHGVMISSLSSSYWAHRFVGAKRMITAQ
jgi:cell wall-associated NlpC family hydrolase